MQASRMRAGNAMGSPYVFSFGTGSDVQQDLTPPRVVDVQPSNRTIGVSPNTVIVVMFSEPMDPTTITTSYYNNQYGSRKYSQHGNAFWISRHN